MPDIFKAILYEDVFYPLSISLDTGVCTRGKIQRLLEPRSLTGKHQTEWDLGTIVYTTLVFHRLC